MVWSHLSCDHGCWRIRSVSVDVRSTTNNHNIYDVYINVDPVMLSLSLPNPALILAQQERIHDIRTRPETAGGPDRSQMFHLGLGASLREGVISYIYMIPLGGAYEAKYLPLPAVLGELLAFGLSITFHTVWRWDSVDARHTKHTRNLVRVVYGFYPFATICVCSVQYIIYCLGLLFCFVSIYPYIDSFVRGTHTALRVAGAYTAATVFVAVARGGG